MALELQALGDFRDGEFLEWRVGQDGSPFDASLKGLCEGVHSGGSCRQCD